jgi:hypothetical protein
MFIYYLVIFYFNEINGKITNYHIILRLLGTNVYHLIIFKVLTSVQGGTNLYYYFFKFK